MEAIWQWGIGLIISLQQFRGPALDGLFTFFTFLGDEEFYLLLLPLLFWSVDFTWGARVGFIFLLSAFVNSILKDGFAHPRPYERNPGVKIGDAEGYGLPSGHAQLSAAVWGWRGRGPVLGRPGTDRTVGQRAERGHAGPARHHRAQRPLSPAPGERHGQRTRVAGRGGARRGRARQGR